MIMSAMMGSGAACAAASVFPCKAKRTSMLRIRRSKRNTVSHMKKYEATDGPMPLIV